MSAAVWQIAVSLVTGGVAVVVLWRAEVAATRIDVRATRDRDEDER